jgi:sugar-phosphatase
MTSESIRCAAVLFDCDGVLVDSDASVARAWTRWARAESLDVERVLSMVHGRRAEDTVGLLVSEDRRAASLRLINQLELDDAPSVTPLPGALACTADLVEGTWAVVTSATRDLAKARLAAVGIDPPVLVTADDVMHGKPAPEGWLRAAAQLGAAISDCIVLEDSAAGVTAAHSAGALMAIGVGERGLATDADLVIRDLRDVVRVGDGVRLTVAARPCRNPR